MRKELPISFYRRAAYNSLKKSLQIITVLSIKTDHALGRFLELQPRLIFLEFERRIRYNDWRREENAITFLHDSDAKHTRLRKATRLISSEKEPMPVLMLRNY